MCDQQSLRSACAYAQSDQSLCLSLEYSMTVKLLTEHHSVQFNLLLTCIYVLKINESQSINTHNLALLIDELCIKKTKYDHNEYVQYCMSNIT